MNPVERARIALECCAAAAEGNQECCLRVVRTVLDDAQFLDGLWRPTCFVVMSSTVAVIVFRGTSDFNDIKNDLAFGHSGTVHNLFNREDEVLMHDGFLGHMQNLVLTDDHWRTIRNSNKDLLICGHSLGGAAATLFTLQMTMLCGLPRISRNKIHCVTFGAPLSANLGACRIVNDNYRHADWGTTFENYVVDSDWIPAISRLWGIAFRGLDALKFLANILASGLVYAQDGSSGVRELWARMECDYRLLGKLYILSTGTAGPHVQEHALSEEAHKHLRFDLNVDLLKFIFENTWVASLFNAVVSTVVHAHDAMQYHLLDHYRSLFLAAFHVDAGTGSQHVILFNRRTNAYLGRKGNDAISVDTVAAATTLRFVYPSIVAASGVFDKHSLLDLPVSPSEGQEFHLMAISDAWCLERVRVINIGDEGRHHGGANRFALGFVERPRQTWKWTNPEGHCASLPVDEDVPIALSCGGRGNDPDSPTTSVRRNMTLRLGDPPQILVSWWQSHEFIWIEAAPQ